MQFRIDPPDTSLHASLLSRLDGVPAGRISTLALQLGLVQQTLQPSVRRPMIALFAGDHGAIAAGASSLPQRLTWQGVERLLSGGALLNAACREMALALTVVDAGVSHDFNPRPGLQSSKIEHGTANYALEPAMWRSQLERALERGRSLAHDFAAQDGNVLGLSCIGVGAEASAALLAHCMHDIDIAQLAACAPDRADEACTRRSALIERALARTGPQRDPLEALREFAGFEIVMLTGALLGAAEKRVLTVLDGFTALAALSVAQRISPAMAHYCLVAAHGTAPGEQALAEALGVSALLDHALAPGEGIGAALSMPVLRTAAACLRSRAGVAPAGRDSGQV
ncbi:MAG: nicotinate-nucleotide--dimethylbenzimidazole phosphoribosyltransferase [Pseudazoarcus pumilus]|nr:nicotinate-nucleotide--dimethylbenzimidazole phosphoribosyltransferase [Pseudazoarcus pumilus]